MQAKLYRTEDTKKSSPIYEIRGQWSGGFTIFASDGNNIETWRPEEHPPAPLQIPDVAEQDPWETRKPWDSVIATLRSGDFGAVTKEKPRLEEAQRAMRKKEREEKQSFEALFFKQADLSHGCPLFEKLAGAVGWKLEDQRAKGVWMLDKEKATAMRRPFRGDLTPFG